MPLIAELKRRNVIKVAMAYLALGWVVTQVAGTMAPYLRLPEWTVPMVVMIGVIGFPCVLIFSWVYELTPEGLKRESEIDRSRSITPVTGKRLDYTIIGLLIAAMAMFALDRFVPRGAAPGEAIGAGPARDSRAGRALDTSADQGAPEAASGGNRAQGGLPPVQLNPKSIAVLPFADMAAAKDQEYMSDGIAEELLNLLAKLPELEVIARTSSFSFKGQNLEIPEIAQRLHVANVLEGSVRTSGNKLRITAQLIEASSGKHLWSQTYDRELADVFAIQDEIAGAVVEQLKIALLGEAPKVRQVDPKAYALYLQARALGRQYTPAGYEQSNALHKQVLEIDPGYAPAWRGLAVNYGNQAIDGLMPAAEANRLAKDAVDRALAADPNYATAWSTRGVGRMNTFDFAGAAQDMQHALELDPADLNIIGNAANLLQFVGRLDQALAANEYVVARDPVNTVAQGNLGGTLLGAGRFDDAIAASRTALSLSPGYSSGESVIGTALLLKGDKEGALAAMQRESGEPYRLAGIAIAQHALGHADKSDSALAELIAKFGENQHGLVAEALAYRGETDKAFEWLENGRGALSPTVVGILTDPLLANLHADPRWARLLQSMGLAPEQLAQIKFEVKLPQDAGQPRPGP